MTVRCELLVLVLALPIPIAICLLFGPRWVREIALALVVDDVVDL